MQVQSYQANPSSMSNATPSIVTVAAIGSTRANITTSVVENQVSVQVTLSEQAQQLAQTDHLASQFIEIQPVPQTPLSGEKLAQAVQIKKAQLHYQVASDVVNLATGKNSDGLSPASAYYLSQNEEVRGAVLSVKAEQQNKQNIQAYQEQTAALNEQYNSL